MIPSFCSMLSRPTAGCSSLRWRLSPEATGSSRRITLDSAVLPVLRPDVHYYAEGVRSLLDRLHLERVILGGVSMGGYVAFEA